jgi:membrane-associated phospholipid phosphatase
MDKLHSFMYKLVIHPSSNQFIGDFQRLCGVKPTDESCKKTFIYWYFRSALHLSSLVTHLLPLCLSLSLSLCLSLYLSLCFHRFCSMTGEELYSLMPLLFWFAPPLAAGYILNFGFICTIAQVSKDIFQLPRPPAGGCGGIVHLEKHHGTEYGMPSAHITGALLPLSVLLNVSRLGSRIPPLYYLIACYHIVSLGLSRLYLGVHSPMDLIGGLLLGLPIMFAIHSNEPIIEELFIFSPYSIYLNLFLLYLFLYHYPLASHWSASYGTGSQFFATYFGVVTAIWFSVHISPSCWSSLQYTALYRTDTEENNPWLCSQLISVGLLVCLIAKISMKEIPLALLTALYRKGIIREKSASHLKDAEGNIVPLKKLYCIEIPARYRLSLCLSPFASSPPCV